MPAAAAAAAVASPSPPGMLVTSWFWLAERLPGALEVSERATVTSEATDASGDRLAAACTPASTLAPCGREGINALAALLYLGKNHCAAQVNSG